MAQGDNTLTKMVVNGGLGSVRSLCSITLELPLRPSALPPGESLHWLSCCQQRCARPLQMRNLIVSCTLLVMGMAQVGRPGWAV